MLQQTTVQAVIPYYKEWLKIFPYVKSLARAPLQKVLRAWQGLGYYQRAKNLHRASKIIVNHYGGRIPQNYEELRRLPGFGDYTTAAVLSFAFDKRYPFLDANIRRVLMRLAGLQDEAHTKNDKFLLEFLIPYLPQKNVGLFNQGLMELGALVCKAKNPLCLLCPIPSFCKAYKEGLQEVIPRPRKRNYQKIEAVVGILRKNQKYLIQKRPSSGLLADLWEFPGGKRKDGETLEEALRREIKEELGADVRKEKFLIKVRHAYTQFQVTLHAYESFLKGEPKLKKNIHRWVTLKALRRYPFASGSAKIIDFLEKMEQAEKRQA
jgi:A/G-specific adenine glycosylase